MTEVKSLRYVSKKFSLGENYLRKLINRRLIDHRLGTDGQYLIPVYDFPRLQGAKDTVRN